MNDLEHILTPLSRRGFIGRSVLLGGAVLSGVLAGGFAYLRRSPRDALAPIEGLSYLSPAQAQLLIRTAEVALPTPSGWVGPDQMPIVQTIEDLIRGLPASVRKQLLLGLSLFDNAAVLTGGHASRFVDLPTASAERYIDEWMNSRSPTQRAIASALVRLVKTAYWSQPATWAQVGFAGPVTKPRGIAALGNTPLPGAR